MRPRRWAAQGGVRGGLRAASCTSAAGRPAPETACSPRSPARAVGLEAGEHRRRNQAGGLIAAGNIGRTSRAVVRGRGAGGAYGAVAGAGWRAGRKKPALPAGLGTRPPAFAVASFCSLLGAPRRSRDRSHPTSLFTALKAAPSDEAAADRRHRSKGVLGRSGDGGGEAAAGTRCARTVRERAEGRARTASTRRSICRRTCWKGWRGRAAGAAAASGDYVGRNTKTSGEVLRR